MSRQFVNVQFHPSDRKSYTYHWEGPPLAEGQLVRVSTPKGEKRVPIVSLYPPDVRPEFETKPVLGLAEG